VQRVLWRRAVQLLRGRVLGIVGVLDVVLGVLRVV
jgi:hypothetical protein